MGKSQIFELKSQNRNFNSLLCEIFWQLRLKNCKLNVLFTVVKIYLTAMSIRAFTTTLVSFAIAYSGWSHVVISILETGTSIRQPQLANLQFCKTRIMQIYLKPPLFLNSSVATYEFRSGTPSASPFSYYRKHPYLCQSCHFQKEGR